MSRSDSAFETYDVVIAGAGPVGLFLACELQSAGCSVVILEKAPHPGSPLKDLPFGLRGLTVPTMEHFDRRGLLGALGDRAAGSQPPVTPDRTHIQRRPAGHFAGIPFFHDQIDNATWPYRLPGPITAIAADMASIETVLAARADALGVLIRRGCSVEGCAQSPDGVTVQTTDGTIRGRWLVGCDGGRSRVRKASGIAFVGTDSEFTGYSVQVELGGPESLNVGRHYTATGMYTYAAPDTIAMVDFDGGACHRTVPITREHVEGVLRKISGIDVVVRSLKLATTWTDRACQAVEYRRGRILLAGDAAHIHSPLGGQGLNLGLGDAMNLGWKLAATIRGDAPPDLLDSYTSERRPIGAQVLDWSRAQVALMRPTRSTRALEGIMRALIDTRDGARYFAERSSGIGLRYDIGGNHPLIGRSAPDFDLVDGTRLNAHFRSGRGVLLDFEGCPALQDLTGHRQWQLAYVAVDARDRLGVRAMMARPDGIVAWVSPTDPNDETAEDAAMRWFGAVEEQGSSVLPT
ncbi:FAD-dependent oxidoreductase [Sphingomonas sp. EC-HK361]|uniref:FAD-dependent monooxygenase n=1 Tax=Sphingomonas sp. EC-HK361 TaxID=2038397 RepID=UPI00125918A0|nr:FAD-dependent monooxygenase [Sphingomonas sp. EC-HK361]VVT14173.1 FAD-dependent oxidoreductase [Sphingomonas sp. EC-HK361]